MGFFHLWVPLQRFVCNIHAATTLHDQGKATAQEINGEQLEELSGSDPSTVQGNREVTFLVGTLRQGRKDSEEAASIRRWERGGAGASGPR